MPAEGEITNELLLTAPAVARLLLCVLCALAHPLCAQTPDEVRPRLRAFRVKEPITIDGRSSDVAWKAAVPGTTFRQVDPDEGQPATERTEVRVLYDDLAIYVGVRLYDSEPSRIVKRLSRRDNYADADRFTIYLDPYHDHLTGAMFEVSAAGVQ